MRNFRQPCATLVQEPTEKGLGFINVPVINVPAIMVTVPVNTSFMITGHQIVIEYCDSAIPIEADDAFHLTLHGLEEAKFAEGDGGLEGEIARFLLQRISDPIALDADALADHRHHTPAPRPAHASAGPLRISPCHATVRLAAPSGCEDWTAPTGI